MRISSNELNNVLNAYVKRVREGAGKPPAATGPRKAGGDTISLSPEAQQLSRLRQRLAELPEACNARVQELKQRVQTGTYRVEASEIAGKLLARAVADRLAGAAEEQ